MMLRGCSPTPAGEKCQRGGLGQLSDDVQHLGGMYHEAGRFFPEEWARFRSSAPEGEREGDLVAAYNRLLNEHSDPAVRARAAKNWCDWEDSLLSLEEGWAPSARYEDAEFRMTFARLCAHYFSHAAWLDGDELLRNAYQLAGIPGFMVHGRLDLGGPPDVPWLLAPGVAGRGAWLRASMVLPRAVAHGCFSRRRLHVR